MERTTATPPLDDEVILPVEDTLDLHTFRPSDIGTLVPDWLAACREAGFLQARLVHGKGSGALRAGALALVERSPLVRGVRSDGNWGAALLELWDPREDEARVRAIVEGSPRLLTMLAAVATVGPPDAWVGAGAVRNRVWHRFHRREGEAEDTDVDVAWAGDPSEDTRFSDALRGALDAPWEVVSQARYGHATAEAGIASWPETATGVAARLRGGRVELFAAHGWADLIGMVVRPGPNVTEDTWRARLAKKRWRQRFPWVRIE